MGLILVGIDRDGTLIKDIGFLGKEENWRGKIEIYKGVIERIRLLNQNKDIKIIIATNQAGVALNLFNEKRVEEINNEINSILIKQNAIIDNWQYCSYVSKEYSRKRNISKSNEYILDDFNPKLQLRKPNAEMLKKAEEELDYRFEDFKKIYFIGDKMVDVKTGLNATGKGILVSNEKNQEEKEKIKFVYKNNPDVLICNNFYEACEFVMKDCEKD